MGQNRSDGKSFTELKLHNWYFFFILFLAILGTYYQSLPYPLINLDDPFYITWNPYIRDLSWGGIYRIFSQPSVDNYFPLQFLSYALDYQIWHLHTFGYRLHNVLLHIVNSALIFLLLKKLFSNPWTSFIAALLFGLHPVNVESVTWIAERKNVLSMALLLSSFLTYLYYLDEQRQTRKIGFYLATLGLFLLALLAKVSAVVLPILFCLFDLCFQKRRKWEMVRDKIPFLALSLLFSFVTVWVYRRAGFLADYHGGSPYTTFLAMVNVFVEYIIYLFVPIYLDHYYWTPIPQTILETQVLLSLAAIILLALLAWRSFRRYPIFFFWLAWFFVSLLPVLNIVPLVILRADRYMYLPAIGFFYLISWGMWKISQGNYKPFGLSIFLSCSLLVAGTYAFLTMERNKLWKDPIIFWEANLRKFPHNPHAYKFLGTIHLKQGRYDLACLYFRAGLQEEPNNVVMLNGLAMAYKNKGDLIRAEDLLLQANRVDPGDSDTYNNLGLIYIQKGGMEKAKAYFQKAVEAFPKNAPAHVNLGVIAKGQNRKKDAIHELERAIGLSPQAIEAYLNLALIYQENGDLNQAESVLKKGLEYSPESQAALSMAGRIAFQQGKIPQARDYLYQARQLNPKNEAVNDLLRLIEQQKAKAL